MNISILYHFPIFDLFSKHSMHGHFRDSNVQNCSGRHSSLITLREGCIIPVIGWIGNNPIGGDYIYPDDYNCSVSMDENPRSAKTHSGISYHAVSG